MANLFTEADHPYPRERVVRLDYTNHRGERRVRLVLPLSVYFGTTTWHPEPCWLLRAVDVEKGEGRDFALARVHGWKEGGGV